MIVRIVKMHFKGGHVETFLEIFHQHKNAIRGVKGCTHLELLRDVQNPLSYMTLSYWENERDLDVYRNSALFRDVWARVKVLFGGPTLALSLEKIEEL